MHNYLELTVPTFVKVTLNMRPLGKISWTVYYEFRQRLSCYDTTKPTVFFISSSPKSLSIYIIAFPS